MQPETSAMEKVKAIIDKRGLKALEKAKKIMLGSDTRNSKISEALNYFTNVTLQDALPVFPALMSLSCEVAGGDPQKTTGPAAALELVSGAADIQDDIIDHSINKYGKKTVFGKYGLETAILAGDFLIAQGSMLLMTECENLPIEARTEIRQAFLRTFLEISEAEIEETSLLKKTSVSPEEYMKTITLKASVPELNCVIGGILASANPVAIRALANFGRTYGIVSLIREEFIDLLEYAEFKNRLTKEIMPLPALFALQNPEIKKKLKTIVKKSSVDRRELLRIAKVIFRSTEADQLRQLMLKMVSNTSSSLPQSKNDAAGLETRLLLEGLAEGI